MKVSELIVQLESLEDFEVEIILRDNEQEGVFPAWNIFEAVVEDVGYSDKVIRLGIGKER
jgi:hypothetical protein